MLICEATPNQIGSAIIIAVSLLGFLLLVAKSVEYIRGKQVNPELFSNLERRVQGIEDDLKFLMRTTRITMRNAAEDLHSPHTPELDVLLEKYHAKEHLTDEQMHRMMEILAKVRDDPNEPHSRRNFAEYIYLGLAKDMEDRKLLGSLILAT